MLPVRTQPPEYGEHHLVDGHRLIQILGRSDGYGLHPEAQPRVGWVGPDGRHVYGVSAETAAAYLGLTEPRDRLERDAAARWQQRDAAAAVVDAVPFTARVASILADAAKTSPCWDAARVAADRLDRVLMDALRDARGRSHSRAAAMLSVLAGADVADDGGHLARIATRLSAR